MTAPSRDGDGLVRAIGQALALAGAAASDVAAVCAHGTGTVYNDAMEMSAFRRVWPDPRPVFSIKGGAGHTMGAAGLVEMLVGLRALREGIVPPTVGLRRAAEEDAAWVSPAARPPAAGGVLLSTNSGFGGVNSALALRAPRGEGAS
jgi:3-oxoacyl-[acyl-carrier-protein] synthase II